MRKILIWITAVTMAFAMTACSSSQSGATDTAEAAVIGLLDAIKAVDQAKVNQYVTPEDSMYSEDTATTEDVETTKLLFENMTYEVTSAEENGDSAVVKVDITTLDMSVIMQQYMQSSLELADSATAAEEITQETTTQLLKDAIEQNKNPTVSSSVELNVNKTEEGWKVETNASFYSAISGGISEELFG